STTVLPLDRLPSSDTASASSSSSDALSSSLAADSLPRSEPPSPPSDPSLSEPPPQPARPRVATIRTAAARVRITGTSFMTTGAWWSPGGPQPNHDCCVLHLPPHFPRNIQSLALQLVASYRRGHGPRARN